MNYKQGDRVKIKSLDWYNENKDEYGYIDCGSRAFFTKMSDWCGKIATIKEICKTNCYHLEEYDFEWTDEMIEGLAEEETKSNIIKEAKTYWDSIKDAWICTDGYIFKDENGNIINATKIVLEKKKKEYPKTYEECCKILGITAIHTIGDVGYKIALLRRLEQLLICRDAYWKIAGDEMGLGKPWEPDWSDDSLKPCIGTASNEIIKCTSYSDNAILTFPTSEMRDAFYENFKELIEQCKEIF